MSVSLARANLSCSKRMSVCAVTESYCYETVASIRGGYWLVWRRCNGHTVTQTKLIYVKTGIGDDL